MTKLFGRDSYYARDKKLIAADAQLLEPLIQSLAATKKTVSKINPYEIIPDATKQALESNIRTNWEAYLLLAKNSGVPDDVLNAVNYHQLQAMDGLDDLKKSVEGLIKQRTDQINRDGGGTKIELDGLNALRLGLEVMLAITKQAVTLENANPAIKSKYFTFAAAGAFVATVGKVMSGAGLGLVGGAMGGAAFVIGPAIKSGGATEMGLALLAAGVGATIGGLCGLIYGAWKNLPEYKAENNPIKRNISMITNNTSLMIDAAKDYQKGLKQNFGAEKESAVQIVAAAFPSPENNKRQSYH